MEWLAAILPGLGEELTVIALGHGEGTLLLPLAIRRMGPFRVADIAGGKQASYHLPLVAGAFATDTEPLRAALTEAGRALMLDAFTFRDSPAQLGAFANPLAGLPGQRAPSSGWELRLDETWDVISARLFDRDDRKKMRQKAKKLAEIGPVFAGWVSGPAIETELEQLFAQKASRLAAMGQRDPFGSPALRRSFLQGIMSARPGLRLFVLRAGSRSLAWMVGASDGRRFSGMVNAHDASADVARASPGEQLLLALVPTLISEGYHAFDLGVGDARYKAQFCPEEIPLFDLALPVSAAGHIAARLFLTSQAIKRRIKTDPALMARWSRLSLLLKR
jgi:CelD/BcsL family acetyltransferase involved in cellulose biosynthesis